MYGESVKGKAGLGLRAGLAALALVIGTSLAAAPGMAQDKDKKPAAGKATAAPKGEAAKGAAAPAAKGDEKKGDEKEQSAWIKLCEKAPNISDPKQQMNVCLTHHERLDGNSGRVLVSAAIREVEGQDKKALMVMIPLGMVLPAGIQFKVDENEPVKLQYTLCHIGGCTAETEATPAIIDQMKKGKQIIVAAINIAGKAIGFPVPLVGFEQALAGKPVDNEKYKEARLRLMETIKHNIEVANEKAKEEQAKGKETKKQ